MRRCIEDIYTTHTGKTFKKVKSTTFEIIRREYKNDYYIAECAVLAFHKALIGLTELRELEEIEENTQYKSLYMSRAINTYYLVYHMFTMIMLLDNDYIPNINIAKDKIELFMKEYIKTSGFDFCSTVMELIFIAFDHNR